MIVYTKEEQRHIKARSELIDVADRYVRVIGEEESAKTLEYVAELFIPTRPDPSLKPIDDSCENLSKVEG